MSALALLLSAAIAQATPAAPIRTRAPAQPPARATVADLAWIVGEWRGERDGSVAGEAYATPVAGQITGLFYEARADKLTLVELSQIVERDGGVVFRYRHFNPDFTGWEDRDGKASEHVLLAIEGKRLFFDGMTLDHSRPDALDFHIRVKGSGTATRDLVYRYRRVR